MIQAGLDVDLFAGSRVARVGHELLKVGDALFRAADVFSLLSVEALGVPVGG